jgi:acetyltransferase-like isoleucine patch superfamily enzyme
MGIIVKIIDYFFDNIVSFFLYYYERFFMYRIKNAWGVANLRKIKNKGVNVKAVGYSRFLDPQNITLGNNVRIGYGCFLFGKGKIVIGDHTILSRNITIYSSNHDYNGNMIPYDSNYVDKPVIIGKGVWIGMGVMITPGVTIGDGAIIGMGAVVSKNVGEGEIVVGASQRVISKRDMTLFREYEKNNAIFSVKHPHS